MYITIKTLLVLLLGRLSLAEPLWVLQSVVPTLPTPPPEVSGTKQIERWESSRSDSIENAWSSYMEADPTKHKHANAEMHDFAATATWGDDLPDWATATTGHWEVLTATPSWFSELPEDVQSIKLEEGGVWASIIGDKKGMAPKETGRAALGVLAGVAVAAAVM